MSNPTMNEKIFDNPENIQISANEVMTVNGTALKSAFLLLLVVLGGSYTWGQFTSGNLELTSALMIVGLIVGFILAMIISFVRKTAPYLAPVYAVAEGLALGGISAQFEAQLPGIVFQAVLGSLAALFTMLALYISRVIRVTDKFRAVIFVATCSIGLIYLVNFIMSFFHMSIPYLYEGGSIGIGISLIIICIATFNFLLDFDIIERGANSFAPKYMEWYCSFGVLVTLVWVYLEILRLLAKLNRK